MKEVWNKNLSLFKKQDHDIVYMYNGKNSFIFTKFRDTAHMDTKVKLISGLNHFLYWLQVNHNVKEDSDYVSSIIISTWTSASLEFSSFIKDVDADVKIKRCILKYCGLENRPGMNYDRLVELACMYIDTIVIKNIQEADSKTDIKLDNFHCSLMHVSALFIKFTYVITSLIRSNIIFNKALKIYIECMLYNVHKGFLKHHNMPHEAKDIDEIGSIMDSFIYKLCGKHWNAAMLSPTYLAKFKAIGVDATHNGQKNKIDIYSSLKKFVPVPEPKEEIEAKYMEGSDGTMKPSDIYWTLDKAFDDFKSPCKVIVKYIQSTVKEVVMNQDKNKKFLQDINVVSILNSSHEESSMNKEFSLYTDKDLHLYGIRNMKAINLFDDVADALGRFDYDLTSNVKYFNLSRGHTFNSYILSKILLATVGEVRIYKEIFGIFSKPLLALFYLATTEKLAINNHIRVNESPFHTSEYDCLITPDGISIMEILKSVGRPNTDVYSLASVSNALLDNNLSIDADSVRSITGYYTLGNGQDVLLTPEMFIGIHRLLSDPDKLRELLLPAVYSPTNRVRLIKNKGTLDNISTISASMEDMEYKKKTVLETYADRQHRLMLEEEANSSIVYNVNIPVVEKI